MLTARDGGAAPEPVKCFSLFWTRVGVRGSGAGVSLAFWTRAGFTPRLAHKTGMPQRSRSCMHRPCAAAGHTCPAGPALDLRGAAGTPSFSGGDGTLWAWGTTRHRRPLVRQSQAQRRGQRHSILLGPFLICFDHDNMIYSIYKYLAGTGNNTSDDIFQMVSCSWARRSPSIIRKGKKMRSANPHTISQATLK